VRSAAADWPRDASLDGLHFDRLYPRAFQPGPDSRFWRQDIILDFNESPAPSWLIRAPSGSGKSTLAACLAGLRRDYEGRLSFRFRRPSGPSGESRDLAVLSEAGWAEIRRTQVTTVHQDFRLVPWLSLADNLSLSPGSRRLSGPARTQRRGETAAWFEAFELDRPLDLPVARLSRGEQQRLALVRSLLEPSRLLILDEAFSHLDRRLHIRVARAVAAACAGRGTAILAFDLEDSGDFAWSGVIDLAGAPS
jgi:putative ABC transport system ATP-binding protein